MKKLLSLFCVTLLFLSACSNQVDPTSEASITLTESIPVPVADTEELQSEVCHHKWSGFPCSGFLTCELCEKRKETGMTHIFEKVSCLENSVCSICGIPGDTGPHSYTLSDDPEIQSCSVCGDTARIANCDFFSNETRAEMYKELIESYQYAELQSYVQQYIDACPPKETDNAYAILSLIEEHISALGNCVISYDSFEEEYTVKYRNAEEISNNVNFVSTVSGSHYEAQVGFIAYDWLFFDHIYIKFSSEEIESNYISGSTINREVLNGGIIQEYATFFVDYDEIEKYETAETIVIRFENSETGEAIDHILTEAERNGIVTLVKLRYTYVELSNLLFRYKNP